MSLESRFESLSDELKAKVKSCRTTEELLKLAEQESIQLSDEELDIISGGGWGCSHLWDDCPKFVGGS